MRSPQTAAIGAALVFAMAAGSALACPVAADLDGAGIRFVGANGADEVHHRLDATRVQIDFFTVGEPGASRAIMIHGVYLSWLGHVDEAGRLVDATASWFAWPEFPEDMPIPEAGLTWTTTQLYSGYGSSLGDAMAYFDGDRPIEDTVNVTVGDLTQWTLGDCTFRALPVEVVTVSADDSYTEFMTYLPDLGTAVLIGVGYSDGTENEIYEYTSVRVEDG